MRLGPLARSKALIEHWPAGKPQRKSGKMAKGETRKTTGGGTHSSSPDGMHKSAKMKSTRGLLGGNTALLATTRSIWSCYSR